MENIMSYYRAMCKREYQTWEKQSGVDKGMEWAVKGLRDGFQVSELKEWVDDTKKSHDLVICVNSSDLFEFSLASRHDRFGDEDSNYMLPLRYMNLVPLSFSRVQVIYDPQAIVSD
ncbi:hypothetical protein ACFLZB_00600, partial [Nanoarchaeota archaeon]